MKKSVSALITGAVLLLNGFSVNSALAQGKSVPPPPPAPSSGVPDILKPRTVPAAPGKPSGGMKPGVVPPPPGGVRTPTAAAPTAPNPGGANLSTLITGSSAGLVKRGMTIREVKQVMSSATFTRVIGPFDQPALSVREGETDLFDIYPAKETDSPTDADTKAGILHVLDSRFQTSEGVSIGMALSEITSIYGEVQQIDHDPGSGAEWVIFEAQPKGLKFTIHGGGEPGALTGIYEEGETITADYAADSKLSSILIFGLEAEEVCKIAGIMIGDDDRVINTAIEVHGFGKLEKGEKTPPNPDDYGSVLQTWNFPDAGISIQTKYYEDGSGGVGSIRMGGNSVQKTGLGVGIGTGKAEAMSAYSGFRNDFSPEQEQEYAGQDVLLLGGAPSYGMVIYFSEGKVSQIELGAPEPETPSTPGANGTDETAIMRGEDVSLESIQKLFEAASFKTEIVEDGAAMLIHDPSPLVKEKAVVVDDSNKRILFLINYEVKEDVADTKILGLVTRLIEEGEARFGFGYSSDAKSIGSFHSLFYEMGIMERSIVDTFNLFSEVNSDAISSVDGVKKIIVKQ